MRRTRKKLLGLRDRAILSVGFLKVGFRRAEIAALKVADFQMNRGLDALWVVRKGGKKGHLAIHPQTAQRIREYLEEAKHGDDLEGPLFRPVERQPAKGRTRVDTSTPVMIDRVLRKYAKTIGLEARLLSTLHARDVYHDSAGEWGQDWRMCSSRPGTPTPRRPSSTIGGGTTRRNQHPFLRRARAARARGAYFSLLPCAGFGETVAAPLTIRKPYFLAFFKRPYALIPQGKNKVLVVVPKFVKGFQVGWLWKETETFYIYQFDHISPGSATHRPVCWKRSFQTRPRVEVVDGLVHFAPISGRRSSGDWGNTCAMWGRTRRVCYRGHAFDVLAETLYLSA